MPATSNLTLDLVVNVSNLSSNNESDLRDSPGSPVMNNLAIQVFFYIIYSIIFILGVFGNVLVCYVVMRNKAMQSVTNFFITNLALSDILNCLLAVPFTPIYTFMGEWIFGSMLCNLLPFSQGVSIYISTLTLTSIAIDRFFVIIYPFKERMKIRTSIGIISSIWIFSIMATMPYGIFNNTIPNNDKYLCMEEWPNQYSRRIFGASTVIMQFVVPFIIITYCYVRVSIKLSDRAKLKPGAKSSRKEELDRIRKRRTNRMLIAMVAIFGFSWLPLNAMNLIEDIHNDVAHWNYYMMIFFIAHAIAMASTCYNPFLYAWLNENFRKEFKRVLPCFGSNSGSPKPFTHNARVEKSCNGNGSLLPPTNSVRLHIVTDKSCATATTEIKAVYTSIPPSPNLSECAQIENKEKTLTA
ncbi:hypothetical protein CHUAL_009321 [Chamberlinius hualienensis]